MNSVDRSISDQELQAYVDGELDSLRQLEIEQQLETNPQLAAEVADYRGYNEALHRLFDPVLDEKIPESLLPNYRPEKKYRWLARAASILMALGMGIVLGWLARGDLMLILPTPHDEDIAVADAFAYHAVYTPEVRHPVEVGVDQQQHLMNWLSKRLHTPVTAPSMNALGFELLGGRLLTTENLPAAQFMYQNAEGRRMTLFLRQRKDDEPITAFEFESQGAQNAFYWIDDRLCFVLVAELPKAELLEAAHLVYAGLNG